MSRLYKVLNYIHRDFCNRINIREEMTNITNCPLTLRRFITVSVSLKRIIKSLKDTLEIAIFNLIWSVIVDFARDNVVLHELFDWDRLCLSVSVTRNVDEFDCELAHLRILSICNHFDIVTSYSDHECVNVLDFLLSVLEFNTEPIIQRLLIRNNSFITIIPLNSLIVFVNKVQPSISVYELRVSHILSHEETNWFSLFASTEVFFTNMIDQCCWIEHWIESRFRNCLKRNWTTESIELESIRN